MICLYSIEKSDVTKRLVLISVSFLIILLLPLLFVPTPDLQAEEEVQKVETVVQKEEMKDKKYGFVYFETAIDRLAGEIAEKSVRAKMKGYIQLKEFVGPEGKEDALARRIKDHLSAKLLIKAEQLKVLADDKERDKIIRRMKEDMKKQLFFKKKVSKRFGGMETPDLFLSGSWKWVVEGKEVEVKAILTNTVTIETVYALRRFHHPNYIAETIAKMEEEERQRVSALKEEQKRLERERKRRKAMEAAIRTAVAGLAVVLLILAARWVILGIRRRGILKNLDPILAELDEFIRPSALWLRTYG